MNVATEELIPESSQSRTPAAAAGQSLKVLLISGFRIFPVNTGGHVRTGSIARALARLGYDVLIYSLAGRQADYRPRDVLKRSHLVDPIAPNLVEETNLGLGYGVLQTIARRLDYPRVWQHALMARGIIPARLKTALRAADIVICDLPWCAPIPGPWAAKPWFLLSHNLEFRLLEQESGRHRKFSAWMHAVESGAPKAFRDIFTCAEEDLEFFRRNDSTRSLHLPLIRCGVDPQAYVVPAGMRERIRAELGLTESDRLLVFAGSGFGPNVEALARLREFCRAHQDFLTQNRLYVLVLGSVVSQPFREGSLIATGRVPEVAPYFAAGDAGLNPILRGSGANVKLFEYLAARLPVISTLFGVRGTALEPNRDFLPFEFDGLGDTLERFVRERTPDEWKAHAEAVWARHYGSCDINELVKRAIAQRPEFAA